MGCWRGYSSQCLGHWVSDTSSAVHRYRTCKMAHSHYMSNVGCVCVPGHLQSIGEHVWVSIIRMIPNNRFGNGELGTHVVYVVICFKVHFPVLFPERILWYKHTRTHCCLSVWMKYTEMGLGRVCVRLLFIMGIVIVLRVLVRFLMFICRCVCSFP